MYCLHYKKKDLIQQKKVVAITTNVVIIGVITTTKKFMQAVVINSKVIGLCNTRFSLQYIEYIAMIYFENLVAIG